MPEVVECSSCFEEIERYPYQIRQHENFFCSNKCQSEYKTKDKVNRSCDNCGDTVKKIVSQDKLSEYSFCDRSCKNEYFTGRNHPRYVEDKAKDEYICNHCENKFYRYPKPDYCDWKYCSRDCYYKDNRGEDHENWSDGWSETGYRNYGPSWEDWRKKIIDRDKVCQLCEDEPERNCVHHIKPAIEFYKDGDVEDAHFNDNLVLLCEVCHGIVERNWKISKQKEKLL